MTENQINVLRYLIIKSRDVKPIAKKLALYLIAVSRGLTREVRFTVTEGVRSWTREDAEAVASGFHDMRSSGGTTHLSVIMTGMETDFHFDHHIGTFCADDGECRYLPNNILSYTVWLSNIAYSRTATNLRVNRKRIEAISPEEPHGIKFAKRPHGSEHPRNPK